MGRRHGWPIPRRMPLPSTLRAVARSGGNSGCCYVAVLRGLWTSPLVVEGRRGWWGPAFVVEGVPVLFGSRIRPGWALLVGERGVGVQKGVPSGYPASRVSRHPKTDHSANQRALTSLWKGKEGSGTGEASLL
jgi:hypothetical protein